MTSIASQMKDLKRRGIQKVLQGMGIAEKTSDDSHSVVNQNFVTLGNFITHLKQSVQGVNSSYDKTTKAQCNAASSLQAYVHSELADEADATTGELAEFFSSITDDEGSVHAVMLQEVTERFSYACNDIANTVLQDLMFTLEELVIKPIVRDEEQNAVTKDLLEERKKLNLDYDSYKRAAQNASPAEQERNEAKMRAARDRFDVCSKKVNEHLALRNYKRSKLIVHSILSVIQQYDKFFIASAALLQEVSGILNPLVEHYQMDERQFMDMMKMESRPVRSPVKDGASVPPAAKQTQRDTPSSPPPPYPHQKAPTPTVPPKPRSAQPHSPPLPKETPNGHADVSPPTAKPAPTLFPDLFGEDPSPQRSSIPNPTPTPATAPAPTPAPVPAPAPKSGPSLIDPWGDLGGDPTTTSNANKSNSNNTKKDATFVDLNFDTPAPTSPPPTQSSNMFGGDPFDIFGAAPLKPQTSMPSQPSMKPTPGNFNTPPQPQQPNNFFKPGATSFNGPPPQAGQPPKGNFYNMPPNYGAKPAAGPGGGFPGGPGFGGPQAGPYGQQQAGPGFGHGGFPGGPAGFGPQPGFGGHGGPPRPGPGGYGFGANGNPYSNPPNAGVSFIPETDGLDSATAAKLRVWAEKGAKKNLRALISSMHEVLWPDSGWEPKGLGELVSPSHVKKAYRQATLIVHPDKVSSCTDEQKIIAKKVFECLSECYEAFKNEPQ